MPYFEPFFKRVKSEENIYQLTEMLLYLERVYSYVDYTKVPNQSDTYGQKRVIVRLFSHRRSGGLGKVFSTPRLRIAKREVYSDVRKLDYLRNEYVHPRYQSRFRLNVDIFMHEDDINSPARCRKLFAHEVGHIISGHFAERDYLAVNKFGDYSSEAYIALLKEQEKEAESFAWQVFFAFDKPLLRKVRSIQNIVEVFGAGLDRRNIIAAFEKVRCMTSDVHIIRNIACYIIAKMKIKHTITGASKESQRLRLSNLVDKEILHFFVTVSNDLSNGKKTICDCGNCAKCSTKASLDCPVKL